MPYGTKGSVKRLIKYMKNTTPEEIYKIIGSIQKHPITWLINGLDKINFK